MIIKSILFFTILATIKAAEFQVLREISAKSLNLYPKIENFHPPKGYQPVTGYEPINYKPNVLNYFLNHKKAPNDQGKSMIYLSFDIYLYINFITFYK